MSDCWISFRESAWRCLRAGGVSLLALSMIVLGPVTTTAQAGMVSTESVIASEAFETRARVHALVDREEVRSELEALGVEIAEAHARVDALSDAELATIAGRLERLPAGGSSLGSVLAVAVIIFIVLIVTDALGVTDIFPWVRNTR